MHCKEPPAESVGWDWLLSNHPKLPPGNFQVGWDRVSGSPQGGASRSHQASADSSLTICGESLTKAKWCLPAGCLGEGLNKRTMAVVLPIFALKSLNSVSLCMSQAFSELLSFRWSPGYMCMSKGAYAWVL